MKVKQYLIDYIVSIYEMFQNILESWTTFMTGTEAHN